ncbi:MAG: hypothetical protein WC924_01760 [Candidatus Gracilibacteria bacterium]
MDATSLRKLKIKACLLFPAAFLFIGGVLAWTAGTFKYWQGWVFCAVTFVWATCIVIIFRILNEEALLKRDLPGYRAYCEKVRYRLIPFVW